ncbi:CHAT domain-containing protein [Kinneretia aquatilis]|uniref:CHAT domain-containing protein n=1 Tax=Kinneretia aquatilis TaxID=2070761 RepID=UPI0014950E77|nr:CHAT domain-containing protein [Paucibacter aquatile]WIV96910.1 CHAT domain-containing protein [Paucibacter aquatile]
MRFARALTVTLSLLSFGPLRANPEGACTREPEALAQQPHPGLAAMNREALSLEALPDRYRLYQAWEDCAWQLMPDEVAGYSLWALHGYRLHQALRKQPDLPLQELLDIHRPHETRAAASGDAEVRMQMLRMLWGSLLNQGRLSEAQSVLAGEIQSRVQVLRAAGPGARSPAALRAQEELVSLSESLYGTVGARPQMEALAETLARELGPDAAPTLILARPLTAYHRRLGRVEQAWQLIDTAYQRARAAHAGDERLLRLLQSERSIVMYERGQVMEAIREHEQVVAYWEAEQAAGRPAWMRLGRAYNNVVRFSHAAGDYPRVLQVAEKASRSPGLAFGLVHAEALPTRLYEQLARHHLGDPQALERGRDIVVHEGAGSNYSLFFTEALLPLAEREGKPELMRWAAGEVERTVTVHSTPLQSNRAILHLARARLEPGLRAWHQWRALALGAMGRSPAHEAQALFENAQRLSASQPRLALVFYKLGALALRRLRSDLPQDSADLQRAGLARYEHHLRAWVELLIDQGRFKDSEAALAFLQEEERGELLRGGRRSASAADGRLRLTAPEQRWQLALAELGRELRQTSDRIDSEIEQTVGLLDRSAVHSQAAQTALDAAVQKLRQLADEGAEPAEPTEADPATRHGPALSPGHARLSYFFLREGRLSLRVQAAGQPARHLQLPLTRSALARQTLALRHCLERRCEQDLPLSQALYQAVMAPALRLLPVSPKPQHLDIAADDVLRYLPFAALHDGQRYLVERFSLSMDSGLPDAKEAAAQPRQGALGLGRSLASEDGRLAPLPAVRRELAALQQHTGAQLRLDPDFTAESLQAALEAGPALVHLASHFVLDPAGREQSYLLLGDGQRLNLVELGRLPWAGVQLAVLSACETALVLDDSTTSRRGRGREWLGLAATLRGAGVQQLMATQWRVADDSTADWLSAFYAQPPWQAASARAQARANLGPALLARAQRHWLQQYRGQTRAHPHFWAAFTWIH